MKSPPSAVAGSSSRPAIGHAGRAASRLGGCNLGASSRLPRAEEHGAVLGGDRGVEGVDRIGIVVERLGDDHLCASACEELAERLVLPRKRRGVRLGPPSVFTPARRRLGMRRAHEHAPERLDHRAAAVRRHHDGLFWIERRSGGTGRRAGLKIRWPSGRVGSSPTFGMSRRRTSAKRTGGRGLGKPGGFPSNSRGRSAGA